MARDPYSCHLRCSVESRTSIRAQKRRPLAMGSALQSSADARLFSGHSVYDPWSSDKKGSVLYLVSVSQIMASSAQFQADWARQVARERSGLDA